MASRFASISDEEVKELTEKLENENTKKKTLYDIRVFKEFVKLDYFETQENRKYSIFSLHIIKRTLHVGSKI